MKQGVAREGADCQGHKELQQVVVEDFLHDGNNGHSQQTH